MHKGGDPHLWEAPAVGTEFEAVALRAIQALRGGLCQACSEIETDASSPRDLARFLGIDKTLAWKVTRIVHAEAAADAVAYVPGSSGMRILTDALARAGARDATVRGLAETAEAFDAVVEEHAGDRATLHLALAHLGPPRPDVEEAVRRKAFQGNAGVWGIQARARLSARFIAPNPARPDVLDGAMVDGYLDLWRVRPNTRWPLCRFRTFHDDGSSIDDGSMPLDNATPTDGLRLLDDFCHGPLPEISAVSDEGGVVYELGAGPLGRTGECTFLHGSRIRGALPRYRTARDEHGDVLSLISVPVETLLLDLFLHRDIAANVEPEIAIFGRLSAEANSRAGTNERNRMPYDGEVLTLGAPAAVDTPLHPDHPALVAYVFDRVGWRAEDFVGFRAIVPYPPLPSTVALRFPLEAAPAG